jgi:hypothetical protein
MLHKYFLTEAIPGPPDLSVEAFRRLKSATAAYAVAWVLVIVFLWVYWFDLNVYVSWTLAVLEALFVPDLKSLKIITESYEQHRERVSPAK